jgi:short-subunit dehydrogenase
VTARRPVFDLTGRHALVTGASQGIGRQLAEELTARGARVTVMARSAAALKELADRIGANAEPADLVDGDQLGDLIARVEVAHGPVDVLVNNAALAVVSPFWEFTPQQLRQTIALNLYAPMELTRQVLPGMIARDRGSVVNVSSLAAMAVMPTVAPYSTCKAGLSQFTAGLQRELRGSSVRLMIVQLGEVAGTELMEGTRSSRPIELASKRLDRLKVMREMPLAEVGTKIADAIEKGRRSIVLPSRMTPLHQLREIPNHINDLLLAGNSSKLDLR